METDRDDRSADAVWWPAPVAEHAIHGSWAVPGSKSLSNRALILAALSQGPSTIEGVLHARDTQLMLGALRALGHDVDITMENPTDPAANLTVRIDPHHMRNDADIDVGLAGTVMRFVPPVAALSFGTTTFDGDPHARQRPMATLIEALRDVGVTIDDQGRGSLPFTIHGSGEVQGGEVYLDASRSSQFVSAFLLSAARFNAGATIHHVGGAIPSLPHIDMTIAMLRQHRVQVHADSSSGMVWHIDPHDIVAVDRRIEPDISNATPLMAAALITGGSITVRNWPEHSLQPAARVIELLSAMGATMEVRDGSLTVSGSGDVHGIEADLGDVGELTPTLAALAALADSPSSFTGIGHLRGHETDRLEALSTELGRLGAHVEQEADALRITPKPLHGTTFYTYDDHRMATAGAIIGLRTPGVVVENIATTRKTLPDFPGMWLQMVQGH